MALIVTTMSVGLVHAVLLVYYAAFCSCEENDLIVLTTASRLREEIKSQLNEVLAESITQFNLSCSSEVQLLLPGDEALISSIQERVTDSVKVTVSKAVKDLLLSEFSHLVTRGYTPSLPASSCKEILELTPLTPSGHYWIRGVDNETRLLFCDMEKNCKGIAGGWTRIVSIDMQKTGSMCPSGLKTLTSPRRLCAMNIDGVGCSSALLSVQGMEYSQVCGKIIGYQMKTPDAFHRFISGQTTIDTNYVDGISMTYGQSPRKHIWTFAGAVHEHNSKPRYVCPCTNTRNSPPPPSVPAFIGNDYFCDTASENYFQYIFYGSDPLWDGDGCGQYNTCCDFNSPPWFRKQISPPTDDDIEIRLCADEGRSNEDIAFEKLEIFVQ